MKLVALTVVFLFTACSFDESGVPVGADDPADDLVCDTDRDCQSVGFGCNVYICNAESRCDVDDILCVEGELCTKDGCAKAPPILCENHADCTPDEGCEAAYCAEGGTCQSYACGASLCNNTDDCASDEECDADGHCVPAPECHEDVECPASAWSCWEPNCDDGGVCGFNDTCASGSHCTADGCVSDTVGDLRIHCDNVSGVTVTFTGDIEDGIMTSSVGELPGTPGKVSIAANVGIGVGAYWPSTSSGIDSTHPACDVAVDGDGKWSCTTALTFGDSVQQFQFVVANAANTALRYFDLSKWTVTGYCAKMAGGGELCSCESLPCTCP